MQLNRTFSVIMYKRITVLERILLVSVVSTLLIFMFVDHLLLVDMFSELYLCQNTTMSDLLL